MQFTKSKINIKLIIFILCLSTYIKESQSGSPTWIPAHYETDLRFAPDHFPPNIPIIRSADPAATVRFIAEYQARNVFDDKCPIYGDPIITWGPFSGYMFGPIVAWSVRCPGWEDPVREAVSYHTRAFCEDGSPPVGTGESWLCFNGHKNISLSCSPKVTNARPKGPNVSCVAHVEENLIPQAGTEVKISSERLNISGATNAAGNFLFTYIPPYNLTTVENIQARCDECKNSATQSIVVKINSSPAINQAPLTNSLPEIDTSQLSESCDIGTYQGNPVESATGIKREIAVDWIDNAPHPLSMIRAYSSAGLSIQTGMGSYWSQPYAGTINVSDSGNNLNVQLGDGTNVVFDKDTGSGAWISDPSSGNIEATTTGWTYIRSSDDSRWIFNNNNPARLLSITQRNGWISTLEYDYFGRVSSITNAFGRRLSLSYDGAGRLYAVTTPSRQRILYDFDANSRLTRVRHPDLSIISYHYEDRRWPQALTGITNQSGQRYATFSYDENGRSINTQHAGGSQSYSFSYPINTNMQGSFIAGTSIDGTIYQTTTQITDPLGNQQIWTFQGGDGQIRVKGSNKAFSGGHVANRSFVTDSTLPQEDVDFLGISTTYTWDLSRRLKISSTRAANRPEAQTQQIQWHPQFRLPVLVTEAGRTSAYSYDAQGNLLGQVVTDTATGQTRHWQWTYNIQGLMATTTEPSGGVWTYDYDAQGNRVTERNPLGHVWRYGYDGAGHVVQMTTPNGLTINTNYDPAGRVTSTEADGETTRYSYTLTGQVASVLLPDGYRVNYSYDAADRLLEVSDNRGSRISYTLDNMGNHIREEVRDARGNLAWVTARSINQLNKIATQQAALGQATRLSYDANGQLVSITDPFEQSTSQSLDGLGRPIATTLADNSQAHQSWNALSQLTSATDPKGVQTRYERNAFDEVVAEVSPDSGTTRYQRDNTGHVVAKTDALGQVTQYQYDPVGRISQITLADGSSQHYSYDASGGFLGGSANQTGFLSAISDVSGSARYERDLQGRVTSKTQSVSDNPNNPTNRIVSYSYVGGSLSQIAYPSGLNVSYQRDASGQIIGIDVQEPGWRQKPKAFITDLSMTALGQPKAWRWASGDSAQRGFDLDGRMSSSEIASIQYDVAGHIVGLTQNLWANAASNPNGADAGAYITPVTWGASYDSRNRLVSFSRTGSDSRYSWDTNSNRLSSIETTTADIDLDGLFDADDYSTSTAQNTQIEGSSNRLLGFAQTLTAIRAGKIVASSNAQVSYGLDAAGNLVSDGLRSLDYDTAGRLNQVRSSHAADARITRYLHNALGQRVFKSEAQSANTAPDPDTLGSSFVDWLLSHFGSVLNTSSQTLLGTQALYADTALPEWALLGEYGNGGANSSEQTEYLWLPLGHNSAIPVGLYRNGRFFAIHSDHLGTPRLITNEGNKVVWQWPYSAFGTNAPSGILKATKNAKQAYTNQPVLLKATTPNFKFNLRYAGQYFDEESQLNYNYQRSYQPRQGRYTQTDPIGLNGGMNRFGYVGGDPLSFIDPMGLDVSLCAQPAFGIPNNPIDHHWIKTDTREAGMGGTKVQRAGQ